MLWMVLLLAFFMVVVCMVGLVLLQEGKGGGLTGNASGMDSVMGARNPLRRWTAYFFVAFILLAIGLNLYFYHSSPSRSQLGGDWGGNNEAAASLPPPTDDPNAAAGLEDDAANAVAVETETPESAAPAVETSPAPATDEDVAGAPGTPVEVSTSANAAEENAAVDAAPAPEVPAVSADAGEAAPAAAE